MVNKRGTRRMRRAKLAHRRRATASWRAPNISLAARIKFIKIRGRSSIEEEEELRSLSSVISDIQAHWHPAKNPRKNVKIKRNR